MRGSSSIASSGGEQPRIQDLWIKDPRPNQHFTRKQSHWGRSNLPEPAAIAAEIAEDREAALAQFAEIAASLSPEPEKDRQD